MSENERYLDTLGIACYVNATLSFCCSFFPIFHVLIGLFMMILPADAFPQNPQNPQNPENELMMAKFMGGFFFLIGASIILIGWAYSFALYYLGRLLRQRRKWMICNILAAVACIAMPLGTIIGVFVLVLINRTECKALFLDELKMP